MMEPWKIYTLEQVCERIYSGGTPSTKHSEYWNGDLKWLSSGETSQRFIYNTERKITQEGVENSSTKLAIKGSTVIATAGQGYTRGQASFLMTDTYMNQSVIACRANKQVVLPLYLYYNLDNRYEEFRLLSDGTSTRGGLSGRIIKKMRIKLPPLKVQAKIIDILYSIDMKIEENERINKNLCVA
ncbi:restriction endonuclease subunit S [Hornefia butyriciproducens]|uniref:restriction endonuclease subunit S n=1 Tax=Hornefia butyriciproducens TaxID=2652293 RepID=UPI003D0356C7